MSCAALVLAAGSSERMGQPKMLLPWKGEPILGHVLRALLQTAMDPLVVVAGTDCTALQEALAFLQDGRLRWAINPNPLQGMLSSVQVGLQVLDEAPVGAMIALGDQPGIPSAVYTQLATIFEREQAGILIPSYLGKRGHPIVVARQHFRFLLSLDPKVDSLHNLTSAFRGEILEYPLSEGAIVKDLDTPSDYRQLIEKEG